jgi:DNA-binding response OmpR family regulator
MLEALIFDQNNGVLQGENGIKVNLSYRETKLVRVFAKHLGSFVAKSILLDTIYHTAEDDTSPLWAESTLRCVISKLRSKIRHTGLTVESKNGFGYRLNQLTEAKQRRCPAFAVEDANRAAMMLQMKD